MKAHKTDDGMVIFYCPGCKTHHGLIVDGSHSKTPEPNNTNSQEEHNQFLKHLQLASNKVKTWPIWKQHLLGQIPGEEITINDEI